MKKALFLITAFILLTVAGIFLFSGIMPLREAAAGTDHNVFGYAWSENIGWVSFNSTTGGGGIDYGVDIDDTGLFSGYAWSENIGWLSFNQSELVGCPSLPCQAILDPATYEVSGWARALNYGGGWDGWLSLRGTATDGSSYGVSLDKPTREFEGFAWGSDVIGWLSFSGPDYRVETLFNFPPSVTELSVSPEDYCATPLQHFTWTFSDPDEDPQEAYQLQVDKEGTFASFGPGEFDSGKVSSATNDKLLLVAKNPGLGQLGYNTTYYWRVKVWDNQGSESNWAAGPSFTTPLHIYPQPDFTWSPSSVSEGELVQFCATQQAGVCTEALSTCYDANNNPVSCSGQTFLWTFEDVTFATGSSPTSENPRVKFNTTDPGQQVSLQITDTTITDRTATCSVTKPINVTLPLPKWKEIAP